MLPEFLRDNRETLIDRCRSKVAARRAPLADRDLLYGIPVFLDQLIHALELERAAESAAVGGARGVAEIDTGWPASDIGTTAAQHGSELLRSGFTVGHVVHDYGDLCQAVTELAVEQGTTVTANEFRILNRRLDEAIANAVTEFGRQHDQCTADESMRAVNERVGFLAHELRNLVATAIIAVRAIKTRSNGLGGEIGGVLDRSLFGLRDLVDCTLLEVRLSAGIPQSRERLPMARFIADVQMAVSMEAAARGLDFIVHPVGEHLAVDGDRQILAAALMNLLQNALKFSRPQGRIALRAYPVADRIRIDVEDECGGLPDGKAEDVFRPFEQLGGGRTGLGLGLAISRRGVEANGGMLAVRNIPGAGCVFTIDLPRAAARPPHS